MGEAMRALLRALGIVLLAASSAAAEDVVLLENGREIRGTVVEDEPGHVKVDLGFGTMTFRRSQVREVRRAKADPAAGPAEPGASSDLAARRVESAVLYVKGERRGTRSFRAVSLPDGWSFHEEVRLFDAKGGIAREVRTDERADLQLRPMSFRVRETDGVAEHRTVTGEVVAGLLHLSLWKDGLRSRSDVPLPEDARFPFAARELFLRDAKALGGKLDLQVWDTRDGALRAFRYREGGARPLRMEGQSVDARLVLRWRGEVAEREWLGPDGTSAVAEVDGADTVAIAATRAAVERLRTGDAEAVTGPDSAARTTYADKVRGFRIGKPDPTWTFEKPPAGAATLLVVANEPLFASVDVMLDPAATARTKTTDAAEALQRACRLAAPDFRIVRDGYDDHEGVTVYRMEATATTKGERTRTLGRVMVKDGRAWRLLAACPEKVFEALRPDLEKVLDSFHVD